VIDTGFFSTPLEAVLNIMAIISAWFLGFAVVNP